MIKAAGDDARLKAYTELLLRYNGALNLLSAQGIEDIDRLLSDGKAYAHAIEKLVDSATTVVDVGSGAGFPGIVIAVLLPGTHVYLVERRRRRAAFLELAVGSLGLDNVTVFPRDVRAMQGVCADVVTAQAVTRLGPLTSLTRHLHRDPCHLFSRRGPEWRDELEEVEEALAAAATNTAAATHEDAPAVAVVGEGPLEQSGSLVALRLTGGPACRSSG